MPNSVRYPCRGCIYFKECGNTNRMVPCIGRETKSEKKRAEKLQKMEENQSE